MYVKLTSRHVIIYYLFLSEPSQEFTNVKVGLCLWQFLWDTGNLTVCNIRNAPLS